MNWHIPPSSSFSLSLSLCVSPQRLDALPLSLDVAGVYSLVVALTGATDMLCSAKCPSSLSAGCEETTAAQDNSSTLLASHHLQPLKDISPLLKGPTSPLKTLSTSLDSLPICSTGHMHAAQHGLPGHRVWSKFSHDTPSLTVGVDTP